MFNSLQVRVMLVISHVLLAVHHFFRSQEGQQFFDDALLGKFKRKKQYKIKQLFGEASMFSTNGRVKTPKEVGSKNSKGKEVVCLKCNHSLESVKRIFGEVLKCPECGAVIKYGCN